VISSSASRAAMLLMLCSLRAPEFAAFLWPIRGAAASAVASRESAIYPVATKS
jgi:hypothetical protein